MFDPPRAPDPASQPSQTSQTPYTPQAPYAPQGTPSLRSNAPHPGMFVKSEPSFLGYLWLPWKRSFDFSGRSGRKEYWAFASVAILGYIGLLTVFIVQIGSMTGGNVSDLENFVAGSAGIGIFVWWLITLLTGTAVAVRRFHDMDQSGWLYTIFIPFYLLMPYVAWIGLIVIGCINGTSGHNRYGPDPYERSLGEVFA